MKTKPQLLSSWTGISCHRLALDGCLKALFCLSILWILCTGNTASGTEYPLHLKDSLGQSLSLKSQPQRIVSLAPSNTETLFAIGAGARVVGVTSYCNYPAETKGLPKVGGFAARTINMEAIISLKPDLVVLGDENQASIAEALTRLGIPALSIKVKNFEDLYAGILLVGCVTDQEASARDLVKNLRSRIERVTEVAARIPQQRRLRVFWEVFDEPLMGAGSNSIIGQEITLAGGLNIFADLPEQYPQVDTEAVLTRNPQVIIGPKLMRAKSLTWERVSRRPGWSQTDAVKNHRIHVLPDEPVSRPGPRLVEGVEMIAFLLYPDLFPDLKPKE